MNLFENIQKPLVEIPPSKKEPGIESKPPVEIPTPKELPRTGPFSIEKLDVKINLEKNEFIPRNGGEWSGEAGDSAWKPDPESIPPEKSRNPEHPYSNPDNLSWEEILQKYGIDGIPFKDGEPDFSAVERGTVEIDDFTDDRDSNFTQADEKMAEQRGCTPEEVAKWRKENNYTWHECKDCKTMQKVPNEIHANVPHSGGVSEYKKNKDA